jgi:hypothetical protein
VRPRGFEPPRPLRTTWPSTTRVYRSATNASSLWTASNRLPSPYERDALPGELQRHGFRGWTRTSEGKGQGLAGDADAPPGTGTGGASRTRRPRDLSSRGLPVAVTPAWYAARGSNSVPSLKRRVHHPSCLQRAEPYRGVEPRSSGWRPGVLAVRPVRHGVSLWFPEGSNLAPAALHAAALPDELENHGRTGRARTGDLVHPKHARSLLRHHPSVRPAPDPVWPGGLEPPVSCFQGMRLHHSAMASRWTAPDSNRETFSLQGSRSSNWS